MLIQILSSKVLEVQIRPKVVLNLRMRESERQAEATGKKQGTNKQKKREAETKENWGIKI